jgi:hypothetical protein
MKKFFILFLLVIVSNKVYCCDCAEKPSITENWEKATQVFIAKVIKVDSTIYGGYGEKVYSFTVKIKKSYKGFFFPDRDYRTILYSDTASCDFVFDVGQEYLIYAKGDDKVLNCSLCSRTNLLSSAGDDEYAVLDKLKSEDYKNRNKIKIVKFQNNIEYQIDLVKDSFDESLKRKDLIICILSGTSILLFLVLMWVIIAYKKRI